MRANRLDIRFSTHIPAEPDEGILYVSMDYATAVHRCACGCGSKVVTPFGPADWQLGFDGTVTLRPSIGNGQLPCRSHYYIRDDTIVWMRSISIEETRAAQQRDRAAAVHQYQPDTTPEPPRPRLLARLRWAIGGGRRYR